MLYHVSELLQPYFGPARLLSSRLLLLAGGTFFAALLIAVFALMTTALYITFFCDVVLVKLDAEGYAVGGPKPERMRVELGAEFEAYERKDESE